MLLDLVAKSRSYRRFHQNVAVDMQTLRDLVELARLSPSGSNRQALKFMLSCDPAQNAEIFPLLRWAGRLANWPGPPEGERPAAYIIILLDKEIFNSPGCDHGIAAQSMLLGAVEKGLGGCMIATIERDELRQRLGIGSQFDIPLIVALGQPKEEVILETLGPGGDVAYWRDEQQRHHVPKRPLEEIIVPIAAKPVPRAPRPQGA